MYAVICAFDDRCVALRAMAKAIRAGLPRDDIHLQPEADAYVAVDDPDERASAAGARAGGILGIAQALWGRLLGPALPGEKGTYRDAVRRGSTVVVVHVASAEEAFDASQLMAQWGAFDVEQRRSHWRRSGSGIACKAVERVNPAARGRARTS